MVLSLHLTSDIVRLAPLTDALLSIGALILIRRHRPYPTALPQQMIIISFRMNGEICRKIFVAKVNEKFKIPVASQPDVSDGI